METFSTYSYDPRHRWHPPPHCPTREDPSVRTILRSLAIAGISSLLAWPALAQQPQDRVIRFGHLNNADHPVSFVAKAQGATRGLRYDPDMGLSVNLSCSSAGHAWLSTMSDERALELVSRQGFGTPKEFGPRAVTSVKALLACLKATRQRGFR